MSQRLEYWPTEHGYYYFRPYNMVHVRDQREIARSWGEDPRNPYDHKVFDRVYEALKGDRASKAEGPQFDFGITPTGAVSASEEPAVKPVSFMLPQETRFRVGHKPIHVPAMRSRQASAQ